MTPQKYLNTISQYVNRACKDFNLQAQVLFPLMEQKVSLASFITTIVTSKISTSSITDTNNGNISNRCDLLCRVITIILSKMFEAKVQDLNMLNEIGDFIFMNTGRTLWATEFNTFVGKHTANNGMMSYDEFAHNEYRKLVDKLPQDISFKEFEHAFHEPLTKIYQNIISRNGKKNR